MAKDSPFRMYQKSLALNTHYKSKTYDYKKYGGKVKATEDAFERSKFKFIFYGLQDKDIDNFELYWISQINRNELKLPYFTALNFKSASDEYFKSVAYLDNFERSFSRDLDIIDKSIDMHTLFQKITYCPNVVPEINGLDIHWLTILELYRSEKVRTKWLQKSSSLIYNMYSTFLERTEKILNEKNPKTNEIIKKEKSKR